MCFEPSLIFPNVGLFFVPVRAATRVLQGVRRSETVLGVDLHPGKVQIGLLGV